MGGSDLCTPERLWRVGLVRVADRRDDRNRQAILWYRWRYRGHAIRWIMDLFPHRPPPLFEGAARGSVVAIAIFAPPRVFCTPVFSGGAFFAREAQMPAELCSPRRAIPSSMRCALMLAVSLKRILVTPSSATLQIWG